LGRRTTGAFLGIDGGASLPAFATPSAAPHL
jgi:hypothetical protein